MFELFCESDLVLNVTRFADELMETTILKMKNYQYENLKYENFEIISNFLIVFKELLFVSIVKLQELKITSIYSHSLIIDLKSKLNFMEFSIHNFIESLRNIADEHLIIFNNILKMFSNLNNDEFLLK